MLFERSRLSAEANRKIDQLMRVNGWSLEKALNELGIVGVASGATSAVGRSKAPILLLVKKRASERASEG